MTKKRFHELKNLLRTTGSHYQMKKFFLEHFARSPELKKTSKPVQDDYLEAMLQMTTLRMLGPVEVTDIKMQRAADYQLTYGEFSAGPHRGEFFHYDKIDTGVAWLHNSTACMRFRARPISEEQALQMLSQAI